jgi:hypothetical protein
MTFDELMRSYDWKPIRNCPGRYVLRGAQSDLSLESLLKDEVEISEFHPALARDAVLVAELEDGGIISYRQRDGSLVHTLNTPEGFRRKLLQLEINLT